MSDPAAPVLPPATIGMLGGGQLGKYALLAANTMGYRTIVLDPDPNAPAGVLADVHLVQAYDDVEALARLAGECTVVTTEFENPSAPALARLAEDVIVAPGPAAVAIAQDRIAEKRFLVEHGFSVGPHGALTPDDAADRSSDGWTRAATLAEDGAIVKTARLGYDGKGQRRVGDEEDLAAAIAEAGPVDCMVESLLDLRMELSVIVARTFAGDVVTWAVAENVHIDSILDVSVVPARIEEGLAGRAVALAGSIAEDLDFVGVLAVELFVVEGPTGPDLLVNELAPRPHNSGHWTLDASTTSQFEQQIRAVCGVGLGDVSMTAPAAAMVNLLGDLWLAGDADSVREPDWSVVFADPRAALHLYGKAEPRRSRKMGHLTVTADTPDEAVRRAVALRSAIDS